MTMRVSDMYRYSQFIGQQKSIGGLRAVEVRQSVLGSCWRYYQKYLTKGSEKYGSGMVEVYQSVFSLSITLFFTLDWLCE